MPALLRDLAERAGFTFVEAFLAVLITGGWFTLSGIADVSILSSAALAGVAAVLALLKGVAAGFRGARGSASFDPRNVGATTSTGAHHR